MANWTMDLENIILTLVKNKFPSDLKTKYGLKSTSFTSKDISPTETSFPKVKVKITSMIEMGQDLDNKTINAVDATVQVDVVTNIKQGDANAIIGEVMEILKSMRFNIPTMPISMQEADLFRSTMRARRVIGNGDIF